MWNHNIHYHPLLLEAVPARCARVLDAGCGQGFLLPELARRSAQVVGIDLDAASLREAAARTAGLGGVELVHGDVMARDLGAPFDAVTCVALLHHLPLREGLRRLADLLAPEGVLAVLGLARSSTARDFACDAIGAVASRLRRLGPGFVPVGAPIRDPAETYREVHAAALQQLPGARFRRHALFRYSLVWSKPRSRPR